MQRHLNVVSVDSSTARENVSRADLQHDIGNYFTFLDTKQTNKHVTLTRAEVRRTLPPQNEKRGMTVESTDRI